MWCQQRKEFLLAGFSSRTLCSRITLLEQEGLTAVVPSSLTHSMIPELQYLCWCSAALCGVIYITQFLLARSWGLCSAKADLVCAQAVNLVMIIVTALQHKGLPCPSQTTLKLTAYLFLTSRWALAGWHNGRFCSWFPFNELEMALHGCRLGVNPWLMCFFTR